MPSNKILKNRKTFFVKSLNETNEKNLRISQFYSSIGAAVDVPKEKLVKLKKLILILASDIHRWDDLIDELNMPIKTSRAITYSFEKLSPQEKQLLISRLGQKKTNYLNTINKEHNEKEHKLLKELGFNEKKYYAQKKRKMDIIEKYFFKEKTIIHKKATKKSITNILRKGNCDFYFYNYMFYKLINKKHVKIIDRFLQNYVVIDLLIDHIQDLKEDLKNNAFNIIPLICDSTFVHKDCESIELVTHEVHNTLFEIAHIYIIKSRKALHKIKQKNLHKLFNFYLEDSSHSFILELRDIYPVLKQCVKKSKHKLIFTHQSTSRS